MAHIRRHPVDNSKWQVRYIDPNRRERSKTFRRKVDAERFLVQVESQKQRGDWIDPDLSATLFADWERDWLTTRVHLKPKTYAGYKSALRVSTSSLDSDAPGWTASTGSRSKSGSPT